jgi:hypothetical protein
LASFFAAPASFRTFPVSKEVDELGKTRKVNPAIELTSRLLGLVAGDSAYDAVLVAADL